MGSADWMPRNLNDRVELMIPVKDPDLCKRLKDMVERELSDNQKAHIMQPDGTWIKTIAPADKVGAQDSFQKLAEKRDEESEMTLAQKMEPYVPVFGKR